FGVKAGGSVGHISGVVNALLRYHYDVEVFSAGSRLMVAPEARYIQLDPPTGYGIPFEGNYYSFNLRVVKSLERELREHEWSFIYQRLSIANYAGVRLSRRYRVPLVLEYNGSEVWIANRWGRPLTYPRLAEQAERVCLRHAHAIVTVSDVLRDQLLATGVPAERIVTYPNCVDPEMFDPNRFQAGDLAELRAQYGISPQAIVIGFLGTFGQWHGVEVMAHAIRLLAEKSRNFLDQEKVHFLIMGDGIRMNALRHILSDESCKGLYTVPGLIRQEEAPRYLAAIDVLLSPHVRNADETKFFGSPTKLFEYMAMGKAIIASELDQIGEVLKNSLRSHQLPFQDPMDAAGELAILCPPGDPHELADAIAFLIKSKKWRCKLGENARIEALRKYTWNHHVRAIVGRLQALGLISSVRCK
ncbi:MAG TPA: glycosyltransferase family 4 protein, partial [Terriglobales bacterium]